MLRRTLKIRVTQSDRIAVTVQPEGGKAKPRGVIAALGRILEALAAVRRASK